MRSSIISRRVLVDSSAFFALIDKGEHTNHPIALAIRDLLINERCHLFTTNFIVAEIHALLLVRLGQAVATKFIRELDSSTVTIIRITEQDELEARAIIFKYNDKDFSLTDATTFSVMDRLEIGTAFSFDHNFIQYGFATMGPDFPN